MRYAGLFVFSVAVWLVIWSASATRVALEARRSGEKAGGVSILGYVTVPPVFLTAVAYAVDLVRGPIGFWVVFGVHVFLCVVASTYVVRTRASMARDDRRGT